MPGLWLIWALVSHPCEKWELGWGFLVDLARSDGHGFPRSLLLLAMVSLTASQDWGQKANVEELEPPWGEGGVGEYCF